MNMNRISSAAVILAFSVGLVVGGGAVNYWFKYSHPNFDDAFLHGQMSVLEAALISLREIRSGRIPEAAEILERKIDASRISLSSEQINASEDNREYRIKLIEQARQYRSRFPSMSNNAGVDETVATGLGSSFGKK